MLTCSANSTCELLGGFAYCVCDAGFATGSDGSSCEPDAGPEFGWALSAGDSAQYTEPGGIVRDQEGNLYVAGQFKGTAHFDATHSLTSNGSADVFVMKLAPGGSLVWVKGLGGTGEDIATGMAFDPSGKLVVTGVFEGVVDLDPSAATHTVTSHGAKDVFLLRLGLDGAWLSSTSFGGPSDDYVASVALRPGGGALLGGNFVGSAVFDPSQGPIMAQGDHDAYVAALDATDALSWVKTFGVAGANNSAIGVGVSPSGACFATGYFYGTTDFAPDQPGGHSATATGQSDVFIVKFDESGSFGWLDTFGGDWYDGGQAITLDSVGRPIVTGEFLGLVDVDPSAQTWNLYSSGDADTFVVKLDPTTGALVWGRSFGGDGIDYPATITLDAADNIFVGGLFWGTTDLDPGPSKLSFAMQGVSGGDAFVVKLNALGGLVWGAGFGGPVIDGTTGIVLDDAGHPVATGFFMNTVDFDLGAGTYNLTASPGSINTFVARF